MTKPERRFTTNRHVALMLDGISELPCAFCAKPCPVPDNVLAVAQRGAELAPIAVCTPCSDTLIEVLPLFRDGLDAAMSRRV